MRADKMTLAALQQVALVYLSGDASSIPLWRMATTSLDQLRHRAEHIATNVAGAKVVDTEAVAGGGSLPGLTIPSVGVAVRPPKPRAAMDALRAFGVVARTESELVVCDLRSVDPADDTVVTAALASL
jgi:L-seryl-tRNA(Ser) seleniumtransferase